MTAALAVLGIVLFAIAVETARWFVARARQPADLRAAIAADNARELRNPRRLLR